jgi:putative Ca2+/H+ antiporter (TMEM165/GDT1 family)
LVPSQKSPERGGAAARYHKTEAAMRDNNGLSIFIGIVVGVLLVIGVVVIAFDSGADRIKTAGLEITPPLIFVPK